MPPPTSLLTSLPTSLLISLTSQLKPLTSLRMESLPARKKPLEKSRRKFNFPLIKQHLEPKNSDRNCTPYRAGQKGLPPVYAQKIGASMKEMIDKWWLVVKAGGTVCTPTEVVQILTEVEKKTDPTKERTASSAAVHQALLKLADDKLKALSKGGKAP